MSTEFAVELRELLEKGLGHQAGFAGHISVELLLDAILCERDAGLLDRYYDNLASLDPERVQAAANAICKKPVEKLVDLLPRFIEVRFLADYHDDKLLLSRLNGVMRRIGLPMMPDRVALWLADARNRVRKHADELLTPP
jgi:hypothetical protein